MATAISNPRMAFNGDLLGPPPIINGEDPKEPRTAGALPR